MLFFISLLLLQEANKDILVDVVLTGNSSIASPWQWGAIINEATTSLWITATAKRSEAGLQPQMTVCTSLSCVGKC